MSHAGELHGVSRGTGAMGEDAAAPRDDLEGGAGGAPVLDEGTCRREANQGARGA